MAISSPTLVSCNARVDESLALQVGGSSYVIVCKTYNSIGFPIRELEVFSTASALAGGTAFFNLKPVPVKILRSDFYLITGVNTTGTVVRLYWNPLTLSLTQATPIPASSLDLDVSTGLNPGTAPTAPSFEAIAPNVLDGRTSLKPNRLYLTYCTTGGACLAQTSLNLGTSWGNVITVEGVAPSVRFVKTNVLDPSGAKETIQAVLQRDT